MTSAACCRCYLTFGSVTTIVGVCMLMEHDGMDRPASCAGSSRASRCVPAVPAAGRVRGSQNVMSSCTL